MESSQVDIIITNDVSLQFIADRGDRFEKRFTCIEACYAVISVKTTLNESSLFDAFDNLLTVPRLEELETAVPLANKSSVLEELPHRIVFAYRGIELSTLQESIKKYVSKRNVDATRLPNMVIVNNKYHLSKVGPDGYQEPSKPFQPWGTMQTRENTLFIGGVSLLAMLTRIQKYANIGSQLLLNFDKYYVRIKRKEEEISKTNPE